MADVDKNQAVIEFLLQCPQIAANRVFFNYINGKDNDKQIVTVSNDRSTNQAYIDGSVMKRYTFTLIDFRSMTDQAIVKVQKPAPGTTQPIPSYPNENVEELFDVQSILDWVETQAEARNFPDFGSDCLIDSMTTSSNTPNLNGVDSSIKPALAKYSMSIFIDYIDRTKQIWR